MSPEIIRTAEESIRNEKRLRHWKIKWQVRQLMQMEGRRERVKRVEVVI